MFYSKLFKGIMLNIEYNMMNYEPQKYFQEGDIYSTFCGLTFIWSRVQVGATIPN